jgi:hypothetical protein
MLLALVRILHYSDVVEATRSLNAHNITLILTIRRLILAALCGLAALLVPSLAQADSLRADLDSGHGRLRHTRLALHHSRTGVYGVVTVRLDDSTLNDSNRLLIAGSAPARARLADVGETPILADAAFTGFPYRRRPPRGPPALLVS